MMGIRTILKVGIFLAVMPAMVLAANLFCPDSPSDVHYRESTATSAPEIKVRTSSQEDGHQWSKLIRPLKIKATKLAKDQRAIAIEEGIEHNCTSPSQIYVAQMI